jgi:hypothetical protein
VPVMKAYGEVKAYLQILTLALDGED